MRNVLIDLHRLGGNPYNGLYHFCQQLGNALLQLPTTDTILHFYMPEKSQSIFPASTNFVTQKSIDKYFKFGTANYDVWHAATTLSWYKPFNNKTKFIFTIHDLNFLEEVEYKPSSKKKYLSLIQKRVDRANYLTFISNFAYTQASKYLNIANKPYSIIYNGCNILNPAFATPPLQKPSKPFLFSIGQLHSRKNFHVLPSLLVNQDLELIIAGVNDTSYTEKVIEEAKKHNVMNKVKLIGPISENEKIWFYMHCKAFVFPSIGEGFGLPVLEAMQFGKPVFLSKETSLPEVGGDAAYYFDNFDPVTMQQNFFSGMHHYDTENPSEQIKARALQFSYANAANQYYNLYNTL